MPARKKTRKTAGRKKVVKKKNSAAKPNKNVKNQPLNYKEKKISNKLEENGGQKIIKKEATAAENIESRSLVEEMQDSYLDYAMSVIVSRALPDVRDGLKPVHRRILYAMWDVGLKSTAKFRKSATIVGEVIGKYHPHGDAAVYDSMVRLAQDFSMRYPLVWGQGNFGSMDGDSAAAYRYTEAKLKSLAEELLFDIEKETVDFAPNFDGSHKEPLVLPAKLPNLLLNGTMGIAVGMATNIPPHNLSELCDGISYLIDNPKASIEDLMKFVKGPDFPTGGIIYDINEIQKAYVMGKGSIVMRGKADIQEASGGKFKIIISEIPYQVNKATLVEKIADLVRDKKIKDIKDLRDESSKEGVRIVIELKKDSYPKKILNQLYKSTQLQETFHVNALALVGGLQPKVLTLKSILEEYIKHREEVIRRRTEFDLNKAKERAHILEGLVRALKNIDSVINTIKKSKDKDEAKNNLIKKFKFTERQTVAILEMRLQQLANLERQKLTDELKEIKKLIAELDSILKSRTKVLNIIKKDLKYIKEKYGDERKTEIVKSAVGEFSVKDLIPNEPTIIIVTKDGYIKRLPPETFKTQARGGKGVVGLTTKEEDIVEHFFTTKTHSDLLFFTTSGRVFQLKAYEAPQTTRTAKGQALVNFLNLAPHEKVTSILDLAELGEYKFLVLVTRNGLIKKVDIKEITKIRKSGLIAIKLKQGDILWWAKPSTGNDEIVLVTKNGMSVRFKEKAIRPMGRTAAGVRGIRLKKDDEVVRMDINEKSVNDKNLDLLVVMENGYGKRTSITEYRIQGRGGTGIKTANITDKTGKIVGARLINNKDLDNDMIIISDNGQVIRLPLKSVSRLSRSTQGVRLMRFKEANDKVASITLI
ncbi:MAG TPA: DNA gyrase subunit A [Candidatus Uhrbacteria bacterium]|nr:DNA gyrase subunit A [Candidatus Uhrbacteria bacterium]